MTVTDVWLAMYPQPLLKRALERDSGLMRRVWELLNRIPSESLLGEGRVYGGGLHKLEPRELANVPVVGIAELRPEDQRPLVQGGLLAATN